MAPSTCSIQIELDRDPPNVSGTVERGESNISGAFVTIRKGTEVIARTITDSDGKYEVYLPPGEDYEIKVTIVEGTTVSSRSVLVTPGVGSVSSVDFDFNISP